MFLYSHRFCRFLLLPDTPQKIDKSWKPATKVPKHQIPTSKQMGLIDKVFLDDEDSSIAFYVAEVKYSAT